jgi:hypothetical protein
MAVVEGTIGFTVLFVSSRPPIGVLFALIFGLRETPQHEQDSSSPSKLRLGTIKGRSLH